MTCVLCLRWPVLCISLYQISYIPEVGAIKISCMDSSHIGGWLLQEDCKIKTVGLSSTKEKEPLLDKQSSMSHQTGLEHAFCICALIICPTLQDIPCTSTSTNLVVVAEHLHSKKQTCCRQRVDNLASSSLALITHHENHCYVVNILLLHHLPFSL